MATLKECEDYARSKGADVAFCMGVVFRLKSIGITHEQILCSAILSQTRSSFDEIFARFGRDVAVMATSIMKDLSQPAKNQESSYIKESELSKTKRSKMMKKNIHYLNSLKKNIRQNQDKALGLQRLLDGANETISELGYRPIKFE